VDDVVAQILATLGRTAGEQAVRQRLELAREIRPLPTPRTLDRVGKAARRTIKGIENFREELKRAGIRNECLDPGSPILNLAYQWGYAQPIDPRFQTKQWVAAYCAVLIIEACTSLPKRVKVHSPLHRVMVIVHEHLYGTTLKNSAGLTACRKALRWHRGESISP
jgi:hypothetical protein